MEIPPRVLVVDDDEAIAGLIAVHLRHGGFEPAWAADAPAAQREVDAIMPDAVILDWLLPGESGYSLLKRWRASARTSLLPILMLTARVEEAEIVAALDAGVDDYITKPFSPLELMARVRAVLRRKDPGPVREELVVGDLVLDCAAHRARFRGQSLMLGPIDFKLLQFLMANPGRVHNRREMLGVHGACIDMPERAVDVHVRRLRSALGPAGPLLETVKGAGYRLAQP